MPSKRIELSSHRLKGECVDRYATTAKTFERTCFCIFFSLFIGRWMWKESNLLASREGNRFTVGLAYRSHNTSENEESRRGFFPGRLPFASCFQLYAAGASWGLWLS